MKSLHDYRGECRAARKRYGRAFNRWRRAKGDARLLREMTNVGGAMLDALARYQCEVRRKGRG